MPAKRMEMKEEMMMHHHSKPMMVLHGLIAIAVGVWVFVMPGVTIEQIVAVLLVLMGLKKLLWAAKCC